jgi:hypothetical protein
MEATERKKVTTLVALVLTLQAVLLSTACSEASPFIDQCTGLRILQHDTRNGRTAQSLAAFAAYQYADGAKNLQSMYVLNDNLQVLWHVSGETLQSFELQGKKWVGNACLALAPGEPVPSGKFRVLLYDRAGHAAEGEFALPRMEASIQDLVPKAVRNQDRMVVTPALEPGRMTRELVVKDWSGTETARYLVQKDTIDLSKDLPGGLAAGALIFLADSRPDEGLLLGSGPW